MTFLNSKAAAYGALGLVALVGVVLVYRTVKKDGAAALGAVGNAINPVSDTNAFYRGVNAVGAAVSGQGQGWSLGSWFYDVTHPNEGRTVTETPMTEDADERHWYSNIFERISE